MLPTNACCVELVPNDGLTGCPWLFAGLPTNSTRLFPNDFNCVVTPGHYRQRRRRCEIRRCRFAVAEIATAAVASDPSSGFTSNAPPLRVALTARRWRPLKFIAQSEIALVSLPLLFARGFGGGGCFLPRAAAFHRISTSLTLL